MGDAVKRTRRVDVPRCQARTKPVWYSPNDHQCPYAAVTELDGEQLCQLHANLWVRGEGDAERNSQ